MGLFPRRGGFPDGIARMAAALASVWDGDPMTGLGIANQPTAVAGRRLTMHVKVNPDVAARIFTHDVLANEGLLSRLLAVAPPSTAGTRAFADPADLVHHDLARYDEQMLRLLAFPAKPRHLRLSAEAREVWINLHDAIEADLGQEWLLGADR